MAQDLLGDSSQTHFTVKLQDPGVRDRRVQKRTIRPPPLQVAPASSPYGYATGIDPGPEGS